MQLEGIGIRAPMIKMIVTSFFTNVKIWLRLKTPKINRHKYGAYCARYVGIVSNYTVTYEAYKHTAINLDLQNMAVVA